MSKLDIRINGELNDFVDKSRRLNWFVLEVEGRPSVKDVLESIGVPHPEIALILCDENCVDFNFCVSEGDRLDVYPHNEHPQVSPGCLLSMPSDLVPFSCPDVTKRSCSVRRPSSEPRPHLSEPRP